MGIVIALSGGGIRGALVGGATISLISYVMANYISKSSYADYEFEEMFMVNDELENILLSIANGCMGAIVGYCCEENIKKRVTKKQ